MGFLDKLKSKFKGKEQEQTEKESIEIYEKGLQKSRKQFSSFLTDLTKRHHKIDEAYFEELEEILIMADIGVATVMDFMDKLRVRVKEEKIEDPKELKEYIIDELFVIYVHGEVLSCRLAVNENGPSVYLFVGVNGVGKTTTIAKLAFKYKKMGKKVLLIAGDTFRAGACEQLHQWSEKVGVSFYGKEEGADPSSVIYEGIEKGLEENVDIILIDTAGRLQNKDYLMRELEKMNRVIGKILPGAPHETLLVIDASTGQNGIAQAKAFKEITPLTGIVLTKLDGTAKGGIVLAIKESVHVPVKFVGFGERAEDLQEFDIEKYIYGLFKGFLEDENEE